jgi:uncharacterized membrane protein YtjA (UPF0391 family)
LARCSGTYLPAAANQYLERRHTMLYWAIVFLIIAIIAGILGFGGIAGAATGIAQILFFVFLIVFVAMLLFGRRTPPA